MSTTQWSERYRWLADGARPGPFRISGQPALRGILEAYDDPSVREIWAMKSAQFGFTQGIELNIVGKSIHLDPGPILILFPKDSAGKKFMRSKLEPAIKATPQLAERIDLSKRGPDNTQDYKRYEGGFLQLAGANSPSNIKTQDYPLVIVEEPDDVSRDVRGQGNSITIARERVKTYGDKSKMVIGGTPTIKRFSQVEAGLETTDKRRYYVDCPHCGHSQTLRWERVRWRSDAMVSHAVYGTHRPDTAVYACEACVTDDDDFSSAGCWTDQAKNLAIAQAEKRADFGWKATAQFTGKAGFYISELISVQYGSRLEVLVTKFLEATHALSNGDDTSMRSFVNNQLGETWEIRSSAPEVQILKDRSESYAQWTVPEGGLVISGSVDVQRGGLQSGDPRLEFKLKAWGGGMESWLIAYQTVLGNPLERATWDALDRALSTEIRHSCGARMVISAMSIDSSDGMTQDAVYAYVRRKGLHHWRAIKGSSNPRKEIFTPPKPIDVTASDKAAKWGLKLYEVGVEKAKDLIDGRLKLEGCGPNRMHFCADLPDLYFAGLVSEVKMPGRGSNKLVWTQKAGVANEPLDLEVYATHAAFGLRLHTYTELDWSNVEISLKQPSLLDSSGHRSATPFTTSTSGPRGTSGAPSAAKPFTGFGSGRGDR